MLGLRHVSVTKLLRSDMAFTWKNSTFCMLLVHVNNFLHKSIVSHDLNRLVKLR